MSILAFTIIAIIVNFIIGFIAAWIDVYKRQGVRGVSAIQLFRGIIQKAYRIRGFHE